VYLHQLPNTAFGVNNFASWGEPASYDAYGERNSAYFPPPLPFEEVAAEIYPFGGRLI
jgi:hypothetical protein